MKGNTRQYSSILGPVDNAFYYVERPENPMNIGALTIFDGHIDYDDLVRVIESRLPKAPRYHQRVTQAAFNLGEPTWITDPNFYIGNHVKMLRLEPPGTEIQLRKMAGRLLSMTLDRDKPLWEVYLISGLPNQTAFFLKVHHCMVDGLAAIDLFSFFMDVSPEFELPQQKKPLYDPPPLPSARELVIDSLVRTIPHRFGLLKKLTKESLRIGSDLLEPDKRLKTLVAAAHLINGNLSPIHKLPINGINTGHQTMVWAEFLLDEVSAIRAQSHASVNDVMLAVLASAVETYTQERGGTNQEFLRVLMPVNVREKEEKGEYGNRISVLPVDVPFNLADPLERLAAVTRYTKVLKESSLAYSMDLILTLPSLMPTPTQASIWGFAPKIFSLLAHTWCTNVAAMSVPTYLLGHELKHVYGFFPLNPSMGLACIVVSYNGRITITLVLDTGIIDDPNELEQHIKNAFAELRTAANVPEMVPNEPLLSPQEPVLHEPETTIVLHSSNGNSTNGSIQHAGSVQMLTLEDVTVEVTRAETMPREAAVVETVTEEAYKLFSNEWAKAFQEVINHSGDYRRASTGWTAGSLAFVMDAAPRYGFDESVSVLLDLHRGECRSAGSVPLQQAMRVASFVIQGGYSTWTDVLKGRTAPLVALTTGRLHLKKGTMLRLVPYTRSANELVRCAQRVPYE
jgi:diacylglycerol O-acyltransferase / wax synthase